MTDHQKVAYKAYIRWLSIPKGERRPGSLKEFCEQAKVTKQDLALFQAHPEYEEDLVTAALDWGKSRLPSLLHSCIDKYQSTGKTEYLKMYKELMLIQKVDKKALEAEANKQGILRELFQSVSD